MYVQKTVQCSQFLFRLEENVIANRLIGRHSKKDVFLTSQNIDNNNHAKYSASKIHLPANLEYLQAGHVGRFSPQRTRDISSSAIVSHPSVNFAVKYQSVRMQYDPHVDSYDSSGNLSLNSSMQSNVPSPFSSKGKSMHLNMPGGQWEQENKFVADDLQKLHYSNLKKYGGRRYYTTLRKFSDSKAETSLAEGSGIAAQQLTKRQKLKKAVAEYGTTVIVFHVGISLISLGTCYLLVSSGLDISQFLKLNESAEGGMASVVSNAGPFVVAYAVHKVFAPVRISITLACTPFIVKYLRNVGYLKR